MYLQGRQPSHINQHYMVVHFVDVEAQTIR